MTSFGSQFLQKLGLKSTEPDEHSQFVNTNVHGLNVRMHRAQSENYGKVQAGLRVVGSSESQISSAPTEMRNSSPQDAFGLSDLSQNAKSFAGSASDGPDYQIKGLLGQGTQGKVWDAVMKRNGRAVVLKCLHEQHVVEIDSKDSAKREQAKLFWRAFRNEIDILEACSGHPNIVKILARAPDYSQLMMEKAETDLNKCLKLNASRLTLGQCQKWSKDILVGVAHLHTLGVTHTDLKPENMLIGSDKQIKICDFGMGQRAAPGTMWAVTGELSTLWYRAPELLLGAKTFGEKIDEWAVGCIIMEMLCGATLFPGQGIGTCQCKDITHRNFNSDQLGKILQVVGSPKSLSGFQCAGHIMDWPQYPRQIEPVVKKYCQAKRLPDEHPDVNGNVRKAYQSTSLWAQAVGGLLIIAPDERVSCRKLLSMPLFNDSATPFAVSNSNKMPKIL